MGAAGSRMAATQAHIRIGDMCGVRSEGLCLQRLFWLLCIVTPLTAAQPNPEAQRDGC